MTDEPLDWTLRRAGPEDAGALALVGAATFLESYAAVLPGADIVEYCADSHSPATYAAWLNDPASRCWLVVTATGAPVGYAVATSPDLPLADLAPEDVELRRIYTLPLSRQRGAGRAMIEESIAWARARGAERLLVGVYRRNERALRFYRRMGFSIVGERTFAVGAGRYQDDVLALPIG